MSVVERERTVPEVRPVTTRDVLCRAADLLEEFGWCQGSFGSSKEGVFCIAGAGLQAARDLGVSWSSPIPEEFHDVFGNNTYSFNDAPGRTKTEVVARLREAAERA